MPTRRCLSLWFPRLAAERLLRLHRGLPPGPFAVVRDERGAQVIASLNGEASALGLFPGQPLRDARAICAALVSHPDNPVAEAAFLSTLRRWAGKFSPWVAEEAPDALILDITGCAHLFGGEEALAREVARDCDTLGLTVCLGIADTRGAAWALARFAGASGSGGRSGDAIDQEARATRSRAARTGGGGTSGRRHWTRGGTPPRREEARLATPAIAPAGATRTALSPLPVAALRIESDTIEALTRLGLRRIGDILGTPRAGLARRFGTGLVRRLDQAMGVEPEPISPARPPLRFALRLGLPEPIGLESDLLAALDRLLPELQARLLRAGRGARRVRAEFSRTDHSRQAIEVGLARPSADPDRIRPLLAMKITEVEAGFGIDLVRLTVPVHEPMRPEQHAGHVEAGRRAAPRGQETAIQDLMGRIGTRLGLEALTRLHPAESHLPEKSALVMAAAFSAPATDWQARGAHVPRPIRLWPPEPVMIPPDPQLPPRFRWRGRDHEVTGAEGPERLSPEWWLDLPDWRTGQRDYWRVTTSRGERLWLYVAHGREMSAGWFCHGRFG